LEKEGVRQVKNNAKANRIIWVGVFKKELKFKPQKASPPNNAATKSSQKSTPIKMINNCLLIAFKFQNVAFI
jgi:hypothetical protein